MAAKEFQQKVEQILLQYEDVEEDGSVGQSELKPSCVVTFTEEEATFDNKEIRRVLADNKANDDQVVVISTTGVYRSGKSFLINTMANYLDYYCQNGSDDGWEKSDIPITGIKWAKGQNQSVTQGIWMIVYPNLVEKKRIVFLDCQGTGDSQQSTSYLDNMIMFYALKLSNLTIVNTKGNVDTNDLQSMGVCVLSTQEKLKAADGFQDLVFVVRDWDDGEEPLSLDLLVKRTKSPDVKKSGGAVLKACRSVKAVGLPHPGMTVTGASETDSVLVKDVGEKFLLACKKLFKQIMIEKPAEASAENISGFDFGWKFRFLGLETVGKVESPMEAYLSSLVGEAYEEAQDSLEQKINEILGNRMMRKIKSQMKSYLKSLFSEDTHGSGEVDDVKTFRSKVEKMEKEAKEAFETVKRQYLADEKVVEHASDERRSEDINRLQGLVDFAIKKAQDQLETLERKEQLRVEVERLRKERLRLDEKLEELTRKREDLAEQEKKRKETIANKKRLKEEEAERERQEKEIEAAKAAEAKRREEQQTERDRLAQEKFERQTEKSGWCRVM